MKMMNSDVTPVFSGDVTDEKDWQDKEDYIGEAEAKYSPSPPSTRNNLQFVDTDEVSLPSQIRKPPLSRVRKLSNPNEKISAPNKNNVESICSVVKPSSTPVVNNHKDNFESHHRENKFSEDCETNYDHIEQKLLPEPVIGGYNNKENMSTLNDDLNLDFASTLTFADTPRFSESKYENYNRVSQDLPSTYNCNNPSYEPNEQNHSTPVPKSLSSNSPSDLSDNIDDTDKMLHSFIRHDPPSVSLTQRSTEMFGPNNPQRYLSSNSFEQNQHILNRLTTNHPQLGLKNNIGHDMNSTETGLPLQHVSPYGSIGKETVTGHLSENVFQMSPQNNVLFPYSMNIQPSYTGIPPGYTLLHQTVQPPPPGLNHYGYSNTNMMIPSDGHNSTTQQFHQKLTMNTFDPYQQSHLSSDSSQKDQDNVPNQSQMSPIETQSPIMSPQNQLQQYQLQMISALNQSLNMMQNPIDLQQNNNHQISEQQGVQQRSNKTREELQQEYIQAMQHVNHLQQQLANAGQLPQGLFANASRLPQGHLSNNSSQHPQDHLANATQLPPGHLAHAAQPPQGPLGNTAQLIQGHLANSAQAPQGQIANAVQLSRDHLANATQPPQGLQHHPYHFSHTSLPSLNNMFYPGIQMMPPSQAVTQVPATSGQLSPNNQTGFPNNHPLNNIATTNSLMPSTIEPAVGRGRGRL